MFPAIMQDILSLLYVQPGYQAPYIGLGDPDAVIPLYSPPYVGHA